MIGAFTGPRHLTFNHLILIYNYTYTQDSQRYILYWRNRKINTRTINNNAKEKKSRTYIQDKTKETAY